MKNIQRLMYFGSLVSAGVILVILMNLPGQDPLNQNADNHVTRFKRIKEIQSEGKIKLKKEHPPQSTPETNTSEPQSLLPRFENLKRKVLPNVGELKEKESLFSNSKMIDWVSSQLKNPLYNLRLQDRLSMIDFLEDAATWKENPKKDEIINTIRQIVYSEDYLRAIGDTKRQMVGDKIELFAILSQEFPEEAQALLEKVKGTKIEKVLKYASRRLPVTILEEKR